MYQERWRERNRLLREKYIENEDIVREKVIQSFQGALKLRIPTCTLQTRSLLQGMLEILHIFITFHIWTHRAYELLYRFLAVLII